MPSSSLHLKIISKLRIRNRGIIYFSVDYLFPGVILNLVIILYLLYFMQSEIQLAEIRGRGDISANDVVSLNVQIAYPGI